MTDSWDSLASAYIDLAGQYGICSAKHQGLVQAWQDVSH